LASIKKKKAGLKSRGNTMYNKLKREPDVILVPRMTRFLEIKIILNKQKIKSKSNKKPRKSKNILFTSPVTEYLLCNPNQYRVQKNKKHCRNSSSFLEQFLAASATKIRAASTPVFLNNSQRRQPLKSEPQVLRFSGSGRGFGRGRNFFFREKKFRPFPRKTSSHLKTPYLPGAGEGG
jgi:hypothetical protein